MRAFFLHAILSEENYLSAVPFPYRTNGENGTLITLVAVGFYPVFYKLTGQFSP
jgi:hypothetical protein